MEKIKHFLLSTNFAVVVFVLIGLRITLCGASIGDALALLSVCGLQAFNKWVEGQKVEPLNEKVTKDLEEIRSHMSGLMIKNSIKPQPGDSTTVNRKFF